MGKGQFFIDHNEKRYEICNKEDSFGIHLARIKFLGFWVTLASITLRWNAQFLEVEVEIYQICKLNVFILKIWSRSFPATYFFITFSGWCNPNFLKKMFNYIYSFGIQTNTTKILKILFGCFPLVTSAAASLVGAYYLFSQQTDVPFLNIIIYYVRARAL